MVRSRMVHAWMAYRQSMKFYSLKPSIDDIPLKRTRMASVRYKKCGQTRETGPVECCTGKEVLHPGHTK